MSKSSINFVHALVAVLLGNAVYFLLEKYLPAPARHVSFKTDLGTLVDFCFCLAVFGVLKALATRRERSRSSKP